MADKITEECIACGAWRTGVPGPVHRGRGPHSTRSTRASAPDCAACAGVVSPYRGVRPGVTRTSPGRNMTGGTPGRRGRKDTFRPLLPFPRYNSFWTSLSNASLSM